MHYNPPPNWPPPPPGWQPPPGWEPDPAWGPAPDGWPVWRADVAPHRDRSRWFVAVATLVVVAACVVGVIWWLNFRGPDQNDTAGVKAAITELAAASNTKDEDRLKSAMCKNTPASVLTQMLTEANAITIDSVTDVRIDGKRATAQVSYHLGNNTSELKRIATVAYEDGWRVCALSPAGAEG